MNDIVISGDQSISRFHFVITKDSNQYFVQDGKSRHGTFLNGNQITAPEPIHDGDVLKVGVSLFWFVIENSASLGDSSQSGPVDIDVMDQQELEFMVPEPASSSPPSGNGKPDKSAKGNVEEKESSNIKTPPAKGKREERSKAKPEPLDRSNLKEDQARSPERTGKSEADRTELPTSALHRIGEELNNAATGKSKQRDKDRDLEPQTFNADPDLTKTLGDELQSSLMNSISQANVAKTSPETGSIETEIEPGSFAVYEPSSAQSTDQSESINQSAGPNEPSAVTERGEESMADISIPTTTSKQLDVEEKSAATLDKFAEIVGEASSPSETNKASDDNAAASRESSSIKQSKPSEIAEDKDSANEPSSVQETTSNGAKSVMSIATESTIVPDWCKKYFSAELNSLTKELADLNEQVRKAQQKIKDVEAQLVTTKGLRNTLLAAQGEELVEACGKVLGLLGWSVKISDDDKSELRLESDDKNPSIVRIVWTETQADRTHLGQLSISQTRYWCEQGIEPKGILIISKTGENGPTQLGSTDFNSELAEYASKKNVCLMTTLQLLAVYKDVVLHNGSTETIKATMLASNGWLSGFNLEPGDSEKEETPTNKLSSLLSA